MAKKSKAITLQGEKVEIHKIPIGKFAELMMAIDKLPEKLNGIISVSELEYLDTQTVVTKLPSLLANAQEDIFELVSVASGVDKLDHYDIDEFVDIVTTVIEINNIQAIVGKVKNLGKVLQNKVK